VWSLDPAKVSSSFPVATSSRARQAREDAGEIDSAAAVVTSEQQLGGHLRVAMPPSFAASLLGPNLHRFLADHPTMSVDVMVTSATPNLVRDRIDVAIALENEPRSKLAHPERAIRRAQLDIVDLP
jgi:DNA-binding transcriptional LysR family regulator